MHRMVRDKVRHLSLGGDRDLRGLYQEPRRSNYELPAGAQRPGLRTDYDQKSFDDGIWNPIPDRVFSVGRVCAGRLLSRPEATTAIRPENHGTSRPIISLQQLQRRTYRHDPRADYPSPAQPIPPGK